MTQNSGPTGKSARAASQGRRVLPAPSVHADLRATTALAAAHKQRSATLVEIRLGQRRRLLDPEPGTPKHDDQRANPEPVAIVGGLAHHRDDLLDGRRVSRIALALVAGHPTSVMPGQGRRRATPTRGIKNDRGRHGITPPIEQRTVPLLYSTRVETRKAERQRTLASTWPCESRHPADQTPRSSSDSKA